MDSFHNSKQQTSSNPLHTSTKPILTQYDPDTSVSLSSHMESSGVDLSHFVHPKYISKNFICPITQSVLPFKGTVSGWGERVGDDQAHRDDEHIHRDDEHIPNKPPPPPLSSSSPLFPRS
jgi:hypothetical protein